MNKKGQFESLSVIIIFAAVVMFIILGSLVLGLGTGILTFFSDTINDATSGLGDISGTNMTNVQQLTIGTTNDFIQQTKWLSSFAIIFSLLIVLGLAVFIRSQEPSGWLIGLYIFLVIFFVITSIFVSNMYEDFVNGNDEIATELKEMTVTTFLILHLPTIITFIGFIGGIIIFGALDELG